MLSLTAEKRTIFGKKLKDVRSKGKLPVVAYGKKGQVGSYFVPMGEFKKVFHSAGESSVISFKTEDGEHDVLVHDVSYDPVLGNPVHADLYVIEKGQKVRVKIPLVIEGTAPAVKALGGVLVTVLREVEVEAEPRNLPHDLKADISSLSTFEDKLLASQIILPAGVVLIANPEDVVALVQEPKEEVVEEAVPVDLSAIELSQEKGKKEEEVIPEADSKE